MSSGSSPASAKAPASTAGRGEPARDGAFPPRAGDEPRRQLRPLPQPGASALRCRVGGGKGAGSLLCVSCVPPHPAPRRQAREPGRVPAPRSRHPPTRLRGSPASRSSPPALPPRPCPGARSQPPHQLPPPPLYPRRSAHAAAILFTSRPRPAPPRSRRCPLRASAPPWRPTCSPIGRGTGPAPPARPPVGCGGATRGRSRLYGFRFRLVLCVTDPPTYPGGRRGAVIDRGSCPSPAGAGLTAAAGRWRAKGKGRRESGCHGDGARGLSPPPLRSGPALPVAGACRAAEPCRQPALLPPSSQAARARGALQQLRGWG